MIFCVVLLSPISHAITPAPNPKSTRGSHGSISRIVFLFSVYESRGRSQRGANCQGAAVGALQSGRDRLRSSGPHLALLRRRLLLLARPNIPRQHGAQPDPDRRYSTLPHFPRSFFASQVTPNFLPDQISQRGEAGLDTSGRCEPWHGGRRARIQGLGGRADPIAWPQRGAA